MRRMLLVGLGLILLSGCTALMQSLSAPARPPAIDATADAIETVLIEDQQNLITKNQRIQMGVPEKQAFAQYMQTMKAIELRNCPTDFREAFARHTVAWDNLYRFAASRSEFKRWIKVGVSAYSGNLVTAAEGALAPDYREKKQLDEAIHTTWSEVEVLAAKYGARMP